MSEELPVEDDLIPIGDSSGDSDSQKLFVTPDEFNRLAGRTSRMEWWAAGVVLVCFIAFVGFIVDAYRYQADTVSSYQDTLARMNDTQSQYMLTNLNFQMEKMASMERSLNDLERRLVTLE
ncbi:MAG: hypothetical protein RIE53_09710 [Rhodothermales bacterium]